VSTPRWLTYDDVDGPKVVRLTPGEWLVGRDPECSIVVRSFGCSRRHAKLVVDADGVQIVDVKSKGGTQVNRTSVVEARLHSGDAILLGTMPFQFVEGAEPVRRPATPPQPPPRSDAAERPARPGLATLTAALERTPGSLREDTRLGELGRDIFALMYVVRRVCAAFKVELPQDSLLQINTVGELLDLVEQAGGTASEPR
jgi:acyl carrier protein